MVLNMTNQIGYSNSRTHFAKLLYAAAFLIVMTTLFLTIWANYTHHLVQIKQPMRLVTVTSYFDVIAATFVFLELLAAIVIFFPREAAASFSRSRMTSPRKSTIGNIGLGVLAGLVSFLLSLPLFLPDKASSLALFFEDHFYNPRDMLLMVVVVSLLPVASEIFFRQILFNQLLEAISLTPALVASVLLFAFVWPIFNQFVAVILAIAMGLLFYRTRSWIACVVGNSTFTIMATAFLVWRSLY